MPADPDQAFCTRSAARIRVLLVDLNDYARYPTLAVGYLAAALRHDGIDVEVLSPLMHGVAAAEREHPERLWDHLQRRLYLSSHPGFLAVRERLHGLARRWSARPRARVLAEVEAALERRPQLVLLSAYLDHHASCVAIGRAARARGIPVVVGGPMFSVPEIARAWREVPGLAAIGRAEAERSLATLVRELVRGGELGALPEVLLPDGREGPSVPRTRDLDALVHPDFDDYPWGRQSERVIPVMASRGCQWARCLFCSDVVTANGRSYRSRSAAAVLEELRRQSARYGTKDFIFLDIKLNSDVGLWRGLIEGMQRTVPGARWIGTAHVDQRGDNGLCAEDLRAAFASGMRRISFGLESGSQAVLDAMEKGCDVERNAEFLRDAHMAGLSVRATMMQGFPGETARDLDLTSEFLRRHGSCLDRIRMSRFKLIPGTRMQERIGERPGAFPALVATRWDARAGRAEYSLEGTTRADYRRAKRGLLRVVHEINRRRLRPGAESFDGLM